ncbi:HAD-IIIA family hydrolase [Candidatus Peribacteria bacterium]|nr:MAG: HAD-IIIA family hydrolase [Candidatus Peribacteria bacterium]
MSPLHALLLDRDGTLIEDQGNTNDVHHLAFLPHVVTGLKRLAKAGLRLFIITNQSCIGRGDVPEAQFLSFQKELTERLATDDIIIEHTFYCPHNTDAGCDCRKPKAGLWHQLQRAYPDIHSAGVLMVGDKDADIGFGKAINARTVRLSSSEYPVTIPSDDTVTDMDELADMLFEEAGERVLSIDAAADFVRTAQKEGKKVVTTNGSFDLFHPGHLFLLSEARKHGDLLIVGVNSNASVKRYKGPDRPIDDEHTRALHVAFHADAVFVFDDDDPREWLKVIRPDVHANAETYGANCIEAPVVKEIGAELVLIPVKKELGSTTEKLARTPRA